MIRKFCLEDIKQLVELERLLFDEHKEIDEYYSPSKSIETLIRSSLQTVLESDDRVIFVVDEGVIVGFIEGCISSRSVFFEESVIGSVSEIYIKKDHRNKGLSKELFSHLLKWFKEKKVKTIEVSSDISNEAAIKAYEKMGFKKHLLTLKKSI